MHKKAFTLVELIVVITILAVLATVAFISFQGYAVSSRDSARMADLSSMQKVLELYNVKNSKYPNPDSGTNITYSGSTAWIQGVFGTSAYTDSSSMSNVPVDPVTGLEYPYSVTVTGKEYQIAVVLEQPFSINLSEQTFAGIQEAIVLVKGNYNGKFIKVRRNTTDYILGVPSILASDITDVKLETILTNMALVYNGYKNLPASFSGSVYNTNPTNGFDFGGSTYVTNNVVLFEGDLDNLKNNQADRVTFLGKLQNSYSGSVIASETGISDLLAIDSTSAGASSNYVATVLNNSLKTNIPVVRVTASNNNNLSCPLIGSEKDTLNLSYGFSYSIEEYCNLTTLDLSYSPLGTLPIELFQLTNLKTLNISNSLITTIPGYIEKLTLLEDFNASNNQISFIDEKFANLNNLTTLNFTNNPLLQDVGRLWDVSNGITYRVYFPSSFIVLNISGNGTNIVIDAIPAG